MHRLLPLLPLLATVFAGAQEAPSPQPVEPEVAPAVDAEAPPASGPLVLDAERAAALARANTERVLAAHAGRAATLAESRARFGQLLPQVRADANYTYYEDSAPPTTGGGDFDLSDNHDRYDAGAQLEQLLWSFGRIDGTLEARGALEQLSAAELLEAERDAAYRARLAVAEVQVEMARLTVARERLEQRQSELEDAEDRFAVGAVAELDVREARIVLIAARNAVRAAVADLARARNELAAAVAIHDRELVVSEEPATIDGIETLIATARTNIAEGPEIASLRAQAALRAADREVERGRALPELSAFGAWRSEGPEVDDQDGQWRVGLSVTWNIYDGGTTWARAAAARADTIRLRRLSEDLARERLRQFDDAVAELETLSERIAAEREAVALAQENYEDARDRYREGVIDRIRLGEANLQITLARLRLIDLRHLEVRAATLLQRLAE